MDEKYTLLWLITVSGLVYFVGSSVVSRYKPHEAPHNIYSSLAPLSSFSSFQLRLSFVLCLSSFVFWTSSAWSLPAQPVVPLFICGSYGLRPSWRVDRGLLKPRHRFLQTHRKTRLRTTGYEPGRRFLKPLPSQYFCSQHFCCTVVGNVCVVQHVGVFPMETVHVPRGA